MLKIFLDSVKKAIIEYESKFTPGKSMPPRRARDVIDLRILLESDFTDLKDAQQQIQTRINTFKTGWWIFQTGKSQLKEKIQTKIDEYDNSFSQAIFNSIHDVKEALPDKECPGTEIGELRAQLDLTEQRANQLEHELNRLIEENKQLKATNAELERRLSTTLVTDTSLSFALGSP